MAVRVIHQSSSGESPPTCLADPDPETLIALADLKNHCKIDISDDDVYVAALRSVAIETVERTIQKALMPRTFEWVTADLASTLRLPLAPVSQVRFVQYAPFPYGPPIGGAMLTLDPSLYFVSPDGRATVINRRAGILYPFVGQANEPVVIRFDAGAATTNISASVLHAIRLIVGGLYEYRQPFNIAAGGMTALPLSRAQISAVDHLLYGEYWQ